MIPIIVTLIPALILCFLHLTGRTPHQLLLYVYLPCLLLVPMYIRFNIGGTLFNPSSCVVFALAALGLMRWHQTLRFTLLDVCMLVNTFNAFYADAHHHPINQGIYACLTSMMAALCPYIIGRTLIEQPGIRIKFVKTVILCLSIVAFFGVWEFRMTRNLFEAVAIQIMGLKVIWGTQVRWGYARVAGPFGHAIVAGIIFTFGLAMQIYLLATKRWSDSTSRGGIFSIFPLKYIKPSYRGYLLLFPMVLGLLMTQSRGPWIGCGLGLIVLVPGLTKNRRRSGILAFLFLLVALSVTWVILDQYTDDSKRGPQNIDQQNAQYRRHLLDTYRPLIDEGGFWGWGTPFPLAQGGYAWAAKQPSIDNEYLRIAMAQGYLGFTLFLIMPLLVAWRLVMLCIRFRAREDIVFAYCLLGAVTATAFTLSTVFLGQPMVQIYFLIFGWVESLRPSRTSEETVAVAKAMPYAFERVFV